MLRAFVFEAVVRPPHSSSSLHRRLGCHAAQRDVMTPDMTDKRLALSAIADSLRDIHSINDFLIAAKVGAETAIGMLDDVERKLLHGLKAINEDAGT